MKMLQSVTILHDINHPFWQSQYRTHVTQTRYSLYIVVLYKLNGRPLNLT